MYTTANTGLKRSWTQTRTFLFKRNIPLKFRVGILNTTKKKISYDYHSSMCIWPKFMEMARKKFPDRASYQQPRSLFCTSFCSEPCLPFWGRQAGGCWLQPAHLPTASIPSLIHLLLYSYYCESTEKLSAKRERLSSLTVKLKAKNKGETWNQERI